MGVFVCAGAPADAEGARVGAFHIVGRCVCERDETLTGTHTHTSTGAADQKRIPELVSLCAAACVEKPMLVFRVHPTLCGAEAEENDLDKLVDIALILNQEAPSPLKRCREDLGQ